ncbi:hypothetical protein [Edaphobacter bradus]|uniref:hypothetical protein n=1 Tax=Edaphobacter bradus TaxID=2259016 RepID=UPI0021DF81BC|nr:hypothetical protein [Edaphobacter bradus]
MTFRELLLLGLVGWTAVGHLGVALSFAMQQREKALRHLGWIGGVWAVYLAALLVTSLLQPQKTVAIGQRQCFDEMCFTVTGADEMPGYLIRDSSRLVRVKVSVTNRGHHTESESILEAYLIDRQGRRWNEVPGLTGVRLTTRVPAGGSVVSEPVFKVAGSASGLGLVFTHGWKQPGVLVLGGSDSLLHKRTVVWLGDRSAQN